MDNLTPELVQARVLLHEPSIVRVRELPIGNRESWRLFLGAVKDLTKGVKAWGLIIDLSDSVERPDAKYREDIKQSLRRLDAVHIAFVQPKNILLRTTLRFTAATFPGKITVHKELGPAAKAIRESLR